MVVAPTLKAANVAAQQLDARASSAASLAYQHGFRWSDDGCWTRLTPGAIDPYTSAVFAGPGENATLRAGDLLLVDEAGMLDQDTALALLTIADEHHARLALVGDRHQLPAVGRGGVLDLAARWADPEAYLTLDTVHRFTRTITVPDGTEVSVADQEYAQLSLAMRWRCRRRAGLAAASAMKSSILALPRHQRTPPGHGGLADNRLRTGRRPQRRDPRASRRGRPGSFICRIVRLHGPELHIIRECA